MIGNHEFLPDSSSSTGEKLKQSLECKNFPFSSSFAILHPNSIRRPVAAAGKGGVSLNLTLLSQVLSTGVQMLSALIPLFFLSVFTVVFDINRQLHYTLELVELSNAQVFFFFSSFPPIFSVVWTVLDSLPLSFPHPAFIASFLVIMIPDDSADMLQNSLSFSCVLQTSHTKCPVMLRAHVLFSHHLGDRGFLELYYV